MSWSPGAAGDVRLRSRRRPVGQPLSLLTGEESRLGTSSAPLPARSASGERIRARPPVSTATRTGGELTVALALAPIPGGAEEGIRARPRGRATSAATARVETQLRESRGEVPRAGGEPAGGHRTSIRSAPATTTLYVSPQVAQVLGSYSADEWLAQRELFQPLVHQDDRERVARRDRRRVPRLRAPRGPSTGCSPRDGRVVQVHDEAVHRFATTTAAPLYTQGYLQDVSERHLAGEERERAPGGGARQLPAEARDRQRKLDVLAQRGRDPRLLPLVPGDAPGACPTSPSTTSPTGASSTSLDEEGQADPDRSGPFRGRDIPPGPEPGPAPGARRPSTSRAEGGPSFSESRICVPSPRPRTGRRRATLPSRAHRGEPLPAPTTWQPAQDLAGMAGLAVDNARLHPRGREGRRSGASPPTYVADGVVLVDRAGTDPALKPGRRSDHGAWLPTRLLGHPAVDAIAWTGAPPRTHPSSARRRSRSSPADAPAGDGPGRALDLDLGGGLLRRHRLRVPRPDRRAARSRN